MGAVFQDIRKIRPYSVQFYPTTSLPESPVPKDFPLLARIRALAGAIQLVGSPQGIGHRVDTYAPPDLLVQLYVADRFLSWTKGAPTPEGVPVYTSQEFWVGSDQSVWVNVGTWEHPTPWSEMKGPAPWNVRFRSVDRVHLH